MRVVVLAGAASGRFPQFTDAAAAFGRHLAQADVEVVYGGGRVGLMGACADAAVLAGGVVTGVIPQSLADAEIAHTGLTELIVVESLHQRKATLAELADAFVALPGGIGTLDELFEAWTWLLLGPHRKPVALLNTAGFWDPLLTALDHMSTAGFIRPADRLLIVADGERFLEAVRTFIPPDNRWSARPAQSPLRSVAWLCVQGGRLLAVRSHNQDVFYLPGGKPEAGETGQQALARELAEELHLTVAPADLTESLVITDQAHGEPGRLLQMTCYTGPASGQPRPGREIAEIAWVTSIDATRCAPALRQVLQRLKTAANRPS